jgi:DNA segregation ATPase FtsK/SpoIIIE-like protein
MYHAIVNGWSRLKHERLELKAAERESSITIISEDVNGAIITWDGEVYRNLRTLAAYEQALDIAIQPVLEQLNTLLEVERARSRAIPPHSYHNEQVYSNESLLAEGQVEAGQEAAGAQLREYVTLSEMARRYGPGSYHRLLLGETVDEGGNYAPVFGDLTDMVHLLISGATKWGKSTFLEAMAKQLALSGDCDLCFVDIGVNTFGALAPYGLYPIAETPELVAALFRELVQEIERRRAKMAQYPLAKTLGQYNQLSGDSLRPIMVFVDEASVLFDDSKEVRNLTVALARMGRKYAIDVAFGGTDFKADTMPTPARGACSARFAFHFNEEGLSRSIIHTKDAINLTVPGRALAVLPGVAGRVEMQCPIVEQWGDLPNATGDVIDLQPVEVETVTETRWTPEQEAEVLRLHGEGVSLSEITRRVFNSKSGGGAAFYKVREIVEKHKDGDK